MYFVPRANIGLPGGRNPISWRYCNGRIAEHQSAGDKSDLAKEFLYSVIVYLSEVICQDGVLWMIYHKHNPAVDEFRSRLEGRTREINYCI